MYQLRPETLTMPSKASAKQRLFVRLLALIAVALVTYFLQKGYEQDGRIWMFLFELLIYAIALMVFLSQQTGRLKSGPDSSKVTFDLLADEDSSVSVYIGIYLFLLMIFVVAKVIFVGPIDEVWMGPWGMFVVAVPILVIVIWRQYNLESLREAS